MAEERPGSTAERQREDDELTRLVEVLEEAGLAETYERPDGTVAVRLTGDGEQLRQSLPEVEEPDA